VFDLPGCLRSGREAAASAVTALGFSCRIGTLRASGSAPAQGPGVVLWRVADPAGTASQFVDVQRDATVADLERAVGAGMRSMEHIKRYTTIGTAHDQGKTSGVVVVGHHFGAARCSDRESGCDHVPRAVYAGGIRCARRP
jgi:sarcosine oxidase subunit alpha